MAAWRRGQSKVGTILMEVVLAIILLFFFFKYIWPQVWNLVKSASSYLLKSVGLG